MPHDAELETTIALAKSAPGNKTKSEWYAELRKHANRRRQPGETIEKAFAKFIEDPDGRPLYAAYKSAKGPSYVAPTEGSTAPPPGSDSGLAKLKQIAAGLRASDGTLTAPQAMAKAILTPEGATAYLQDRRARIGA
ncbi:MAG TPA: hypothetical protein VK804_02755 [Bradyrhizobium sp.]|jgi:hypothetical protein|uniref:hypothetical protein n=1 Tax=Bradyrhizobium sp. TaxID=376 RepID=UPI002BC8C011|nr:hypothetical protein [Bradyrhizobium sp.]HTA99370.1 hypothetical protein [Bradyrhizobium sp.]